jgi:hypothetical protein
VCEAHLNAVDCDGDGEIVPPLLVPNLLYVHNVLIRLQHCPPDPCDANL